MKHTKWIAALAALTLGFVACSNDDDDSANNTPQNNTATYTVTFDADGGTFKSGEDGFTLSEDKTKLTATVQRGKAIPKPTAVPTKEATEDESYVFYYWIEKDTLPEFDFTKTASEDLTLYALYTVVPNIDKKDFSDDTADRDGDSESDGKVHDSTSEAANAVKGFMWTEATARSTSGGTG